MKKYWKVLLSLVMAFLITAAMFSPALASTKSVSGTCDGYPCSGSCSCSFSTNGGTASTTYAHGGKLYAKVYVYSQSLDGLSWYSVNNSSTDYNTYVSVFMEKQPWNYNLNYAYGFSSVQAFPSEVIWSKNTANAPAS